MESKGGSNNGQLLSNGVIKYTYNKELQKIMALKLTKVELKKEMQKLKWRD